jgi:demethylmenaquinone methyltransferase/2-methoxy-6-polyprenyl-1,4-benzoquinol methylase
VSSLLERVLGNAVLYDLVQRVAGIEELRRRLAPALGGLEPGALLDVGAGTGAFFDLLPSHVKYVPLDVDERKLARLRERHDGVEGVVGSATAIPFEDGSFEYTLCTNVSHHLVDADAELMFAELARVTGKQLVFVDALRTSRVASRILWSVDRGSHPRSHAELVEKLTSRFEPVRAEVFAVRHTYLLFVGAPRAGAAG